MIPLNSVINFNSIKVRLKLEYSNLTNAYKALFQFHKGTIKTNEDKATFPTFNLFQFHKGTIKTLNIIT